MTEAAPEPMPGEEPLPGTGPDTTPPDPPAPGTGEPDDDGGQAAGDQEQAGSDAVPF